MNGKFDIDEQTFKHMERHDQLWILFSTFNSQRNDCDGRFKEIEQGIGCLKNRRKGDRRKDAAMSAGGGVIGGFLAMLAKLSLFR